jgi:hypothetical protein
MTPTTKREAEDMIQGLEDRGDRCADAAGALEAERIVGCVEQMMTRATRYRAEAARLRTLLPTLPE